MQIELADFSILGKEVIEQGNRLVALSLQKILDGIVSAGMRLILVDEAVSTLWACPNAIRDQLVSTNYLARLSHTKFRRKSNSSPPSSQAVRVISQILRFLFRKPDKRNRIVHPMTQYHCPQIMSAHYEQQAEENRELGNDDRSSQALV